jgi:hypothetical protein
MVWTRSCEHGIVLSRYVCEMLGNSREYKQLVAS